MGQPTASARYRPVTAPAKTLAGLRSLPCLLLLNCCAARWRSRRSRLPVPRNRSFLGTPQKDCPATSDRPRRLQPRPRRRASLAIPLPDVAARSEDLKRMLRGIVRQLPDSDQLDAMQATLDERYEELQSKQRGPTRCWPPRPALWRFAKKKTTGEASEGDRRCRDAVAGLGQRRAVGHPADCRRSSRSGTPRWRKTKHAGAWAPRRMSSRSRAHRLQQLKTQAQDQLRVIVNLQVRGRQPGPDSRSTSWTSYSALASIWTAVCSSATACRFGS